ncbi:MAG: C39 family peptidase [Candidatus Aenigmatarchaeota archaeon]
MKIRLKIPYCKQKEMTCGPSCLQQIFAYHGKIVDLDDIIKILDKKKGFVLTGTSTWHLGFCADAFGYKSDVISYDVNIIDPTWMKLSKKELVKKITKRIILEKLSFSKTRLMAMQDYILYGGSYSFTMPSKDILLKYLKKKIPVIIRLCSTLLYNNSRIDWNSCKFNDIKGYPFGHYVVVSGYENGHFIITDPSAIRGGTYKVDENKLLFSWFFWGGEMLAVKRR